MGTEARRRDSNLLRHTRYLPPRYVHLQANIPYCYTQRQGRVYMAYVSTERERRKDMDTLRGQDILQEEPQTNTQVNTRV